MGSCKKLLLRMAAAIVVLACAIFVPLSFSEGSEVVNVATPEDLVTAIANGGTVNITSSIEVTIPDSSSVSGGEWYGIVISNDLTLTASDGAILTFNVPDSNYSTFYGIYITSGSVTLSGLSIVATSGIEGKFTAVGLASSGAASTPTVTVDGCSVTANTGFYVGAGSLLFDYNSSSVSKTSLNSNSTGSSGVVVRDGTVTIHEGSLSISNFTNGIHQDGGTCYVRETIETSNVTNPFFISSGSMYIGVSLTLLEGSWGFTMASNLSTPVSISYRLGSTFQASLGFDDVTSVPSGTMVFSGEQLSYADLPRFALVSTGATAGALYYFDGTYYINQYGQKATPGSAPASGAGIYYVSEDLAFSDPPYLADILEAFGNSATASFENGVYKVSLTGDVTSTVDILDVWGAIEVDLRGHGIIPTEGMGVFVQPGGSGVQVTITSSVEGGIIRGSPGSDGLYVRSTSGSVHLSNITVMGGDGLAGTAGDVHGGSGGTGIDTTAPLQMTNVTVTGGNGGDGADVTGQYEYGGDGGNGGLALLISSSVSASGCSIRGGNGGDGGDSQLWIAGDGGDGGSAVDWGDSASGDITGENGSSGSPGVSNLNVGNVTIIAKYADGNPISGGRVLLRLMDDTILCEGVLDSEGKIEFEDVPYGRYGVVVTYGIQSMTIVDSVEVETSTTSVEVNGTSVDGKAVNASISSPYVPLVSDSLADIVTSDMVVEAISYVTVELSGRYLTDDTIKASIDSRASSNNDILSYYYEISLTLSYDGSASSTPLATLSSLPTFSIPLPLNLISQSSNIVVYTMHEGVVSSLPRVADSSFDASTSSCCSVRDVGGTFFVMIKSNQFSPFAIGYEAPTPEPEPDPTPTPTPPPTTFDAEAVDNLIYITVTNPQSGREYAVRDGSGGLQTTWSSGSGTIRFGPLQPGDTYSVVSRNSIVLRESTEATFVIPEVPEIVVVSVSAESVTLASDEGVRYLLTDSGGNRIGTWVTGDGSDIVWEELLPEEAYYAQAEVGQGRVILTAGPVLVRPPMGGEVTGDIRHEEAYIYVEPYEGWEYSLDGGPWQSSERIVYGPLAPGEVTLLARNAEAGLTLERVVDVPIAPTRATYTDRTVTITTEEGKTYMLADVDGGSVRGPGGGTSGSPAPAGTSPGRAWTRAPTTSSTSSPARASTPSSSAPRPSSWRRRWSPSPEPTTGTTCTSRSTTWPRAGSTPSRRPTAPS